MSGRGSDGFSSELPPIKAITSLAKKQGDVTRQGTQKLKFVPTLPSRRKKEEVKPEPLPHATPPTSTSSFRGKGRGEARGRGKGRGISRSEVEMTASGPFAMGPTYSGSNVARRTVPQTNLAPVSVSGLNAIPGSSHLRSAPGAQNDAGTKNEEDVEVYSDPEQGVEIVDMGSVRQLDFMAPESLRKESRYKGTQKQELFTTTATFKESDHANVLDLGDTSDEQDPNGVLEDFSGATDVNKARQVQDDRIYLFQFPVPFPTFVQSDPSSPQPADGNTANPEITQAAASVGSRVSAVKDPTAATENSQVTVDGIIGRLEIYRSGAAKMRLVNGVVLDVTTATQSSFFQQAAFLDKNKDRLLVLGEVTKSFSVSPNIEVLLSAMELADTSSNVPLADESLIQMDIT